MLEESELINAPAAEGNYMTGRNGNSVNNVCFHHVVGTAESAVSKFRTPGVQVSSHFVVGPDKVYVCVNTDDTAYTNGNWSSNLTSVTIEHAGTWLNGFRDEGVINQSARLVAWLRTIYPGIGYNRHRQVSTAPTACPGDLPVEEIWNRATAILNPAPVPAPTPIPPPPTIVITDIQNKTLVTNKQANLYDLNSGAVIKTVAKDTGVEVSASARVNGIDYYLTEYSYSKGVNNGFKAEDFIVPTIPPPTPEPTPTPPSDIDVENNNLLKQILALLTALVAKITSIFK